MSPLSIEELEKLLAELQPFISQLQQDGFNIGVDSYCTVHNLLLALAVQGILTNDFSKLRTLIAPVLCCSEKEQEIFNRYFDDWLQVLKAQPIPPIIEELAKVEQQQKRTKKAYFVLSFLVVLGVAVIPFGNYLGEMISSQLFAKLHPIPVTDIVILPKHQANIPDVPNLPIKQSAELIIQQPPVIPLPKFSDSDKFQYTGWMTFAVLALILFWYLVRYIQLQRFLKRHAVLQPPDLNDFFIKNQQKNPYSSAAFARIAQQLHKHRDLDAQLLDVEATVRRTIKKCGFYSPAYTAIRALPEYLVLIDRASFNDQLSQFVDSLIKELDDFGLFIERYYFYGDPRRCYPARQPTKPCTLESLQSLYANHRLIVFTDTQNFFDPITGKINQWTDKLREWQTIALFTFESPTHCDYYQQKLQESGLIKLPAGKDGLQALANHLSAGVAIVQEQRGGMTDLYPSLLQQRPRRFLERHTPAKEITAELLTQLHNYLGLDGFNWLAACAVYPQMQSQLTQHLGYTLLGEANFDQSLFIRLLRLPWFRYGYMPDWLRWLLLADLPDEQDKNIRAVIYQLLLTASAQLEGKQGFIKLEVAKDGEVLHWAKRIVRVWTRQVDEENALKDFVFQSFLKNKLAFKPPPKPFPPHPKNSYLTGLAVIGLTVLAFFMIKNYLPKQKPPIRSETVGNVQFNMVILNGGCFMMGSPKTEQVRNGDENQHKVCVDDFEIGQTEVTQALWKEVMDNHPSKFTGDDLPVETVSWYDIQEFIEKLNQRTGKTYRLPTEAEWEYAARAGKNTPYPWGNVASHDDANYGTEVCCAGLISGKDEWLNTSPVGSFPANAFGLYDTAGNVWEWTCSDYVKTYDGSEAKCHNPDNPSSVRALRGGSLDNGSLALRSAGRYRFVAANQRFVLGFRLALGNSIASTTSLPPPIVNSQNIRLTSAILPPMEIIKGGCFLMGSPESELERNKDAEQHKVCVKDFEIGKYEVTQALWQAIMGSNPSNFRENKLPVESVSWNEVQEFIKKLNQQTRDKYRLPTEAEWEYAARAGTTTTFYTGDCINTLQANFDGSYDYNNCGKSDSKEKTVEIGSYPANGWGLYDMAGNVWEWTCSTYVENYDGSETKCHSIDNTTGFMFVMRGGSWSWNTKFVRSAERHKIDADYHDIDVGFRLAK